MKKNELKEKRSENFTPLSNYGSNTRRTGKLFIEEVL
jgi:hypothetical protein